MVSLKLWASGTPTSDCSLGFFMLKGHFSFLCYIKNMFPYFVPNLVQSLNQENIMLMGKSLVKFQGNFKFFCIYLKGRNFIGNLIWRFTNFI